MKFLVVGDSFTKGHGLRYEQKDPLLWVNQLIRSEYPDAEIINNAESGADNKIIFQYAYQELTTRHYDFSLICWSELSRICFHFGLELYSTKQRLNTVESYDVHINPGITINARSTESVRNFYMKYYNHHWALVDLIIYTNVLIKLAQGRICFVNGLADIGENFFTRKIIKTPSNLSKFEQELLSVDTRDDIEIVNLYNKVHDDYQKNGSIQENYWLNLYNPLTQMQIDYLSDSDSHPGYKSQDVFFNRLYKKFYEKVNASKATN